MLTLQLRCQVRFQYVSLRKSAVAFFVYERDSLEILLGSTWISLGALEKVHNAQIHTRAQLFQSVLAPSIPNGCYDDYYDDYLLGPGFLSRLDRTA